MGDIIYLAGRGQRPILLLVESATLLRVEIAGALRRRDFQVLEAVNGEEALALLRSGRMAHAMLCAQDLDGAPSGLELAATVQREFPNVKPLLGVRKTGGRKEHDLATLARPYEADAVEAAVRAGLAGQPGGASLDRP